MDKDVMKALQMASSEELMCELMARHRHCVIGIAKEQKGIINNILVKYRCADTFVIGLGICDTIKDMIFQDSTFAHDYDEDCDE